MVVSHRFSGDTPSTNTSYMLAMREGGSLENRLAGAYPNVKILAKRAGEHTVEILCCSARLKRL